MEKGARSRTKRLDVTLVERGLAPSRQRAQALILAGRVDVQGVRSCKAGTPVRPDAEISVKDDPNPFVSRGGLKLAAALDAFPVDPAGRTVIDVGASTGGFTDCLLQRGAARVYAVDVGYGQLDWTLRQDSRVVVLERLNARYLRQEHVPEPCDLAVCDASFISLAKLLPAVIERLTPGADLIALIKPQFEGLRGEIKRGVVRDPDVRATIVERVVAQLEALGLRARGRLDSPVHGPKGNVETLSWWVV